MSENNKVKYNLKNTHYALLSFGTDGTPAFGTPVPMPGSVSIALNANGEPEVFYADGIAYYVVNNNMGYEGDLELAMVPESFRTDVLKEEPDANGVLIESADAEIVPFALLFEFDGDRKHIRHVLYNCSASRPGIEGKTNEDSKEVQTETLSIKAAPLPDGKVKAKTGNNTNAAAYNGWYNAVYMPQAAPAPDATLASLSLGALELTPEFDPDVTVYTASTENAANTVTASASDSNAVIAITVNGSEHTNGTAAAWETGENTVVISVTNGTASKTYTVTVTKGE